MYRSAVFAGLLLCGCGRHDDSTPAKASSSPAVATTSTALASNSFLNTEPKPSEALSDEGQVRVAALEYMLRNRLARLTNGIIFTSLTNQEIQALAAKLPDCRFRPIDKMIGGDDDKLRDSESHGVGLGLIIGSVQINTNEATVDLAGLDIASAVMFQCHMSRRHSEWVVLSVSDEGVADGPRRGRPRRE